MSEQEIARLRAFLEPIAKMQWRSGKPCITGEMAEDWQDEAHAILTTLASRTPEGMVMVPREMLAAAVETYEGEWGEANSPTAWPNRMKAMLSASPTPTPEGAA